MDPEVRDIAGRRTQVTVRRTAGESSGDRHQRDGNNEPDLDPYIFDMILEANQDITLTQTLKEGDIAVDNTRNALNCDGCLWDKNNNGNVIVPYLLDPKFSETNADRINQVFKEFEAMTCVQFVTRTSEKDYLNIKSDQGGCWSNIGKTSEEQVVSLSADYCMVYGTIQHEIMHSLGFFHEHTRKDRDDYINILWENIDQGGIGSFDIKNGDTLGLPYDYASVLHYPPDAYSKNDLPTIVPKPDSSVPIGQRTGMSNLDLMKINALYKCNLCRTKLMTNSGSFSGNSSFANQYGGNCLWLIQLSSGKISLQFSNLAISSTDYIKVYDGVSKSSRVLLDKTYGTKNISPVVSSDRNMLVEFVSKAGSKSSQFSVSYRTTS
ncbi:astacin-like metalloendopeptidase [Dendropsophus ebraccatus]|uniref:astacin-like metalloendopeptidase n=1 Tax=Dendropsophus ebraccatus TaxID=150705 RepID=UPI003831BA10